MAVRFNIATSQWEDDEVTANQARLDALEDGVYTDTRTGWTGTLQRPSTARGLARGNDGRPKVGLMGASGKEDRVNEIRRAFLDDLVPSDKGPEGFGNG